MSGRSMWEFYYVYNILSYAYVRLLALATVSNDPLHPLSIP